MIPARHAILAPTLFDGHQTLRDAAILVENGRIAGIGRGGDVPEGVPVEALPADVWLAPGFIDLQVNGGGDVLLNDDPSPAAMAAIAAAHRRFGTTGLLPTLITAPRETMRGAVRAAGEAARANPSVLGLHLEGPFLSPERPGVHDPALIRLCEPEDEAILGELQWGVLLVTLAPERAPPGLVRRLAERGVRVALGHSMATYDETRTALDEGLAGFTHLLNAMRPLASRDPGPIAAALEASGAWFGLIVDGEHVHPAMMRLALRGAAAPILVTDAMPTVGGARPGFTLNGAEIRLADGRLERADGTLAGAHLTMAEAVGNAVAMLGAPLTETLRWASAHPADALGLGDRLGRVEPGYRADLVAFRPDGMAVLRTWVAGEGG
jgi:N-acetylglucosamine-6-phosphate deacetylase